MSFRVALRREVTLTPELFFPTPRASLMAEESKQQGSSPSTDEDVEIPETQIQDDIEPALFYRMAAIFVGLFAVHPFQYALFLFSYPNEGRRVGEDARYRAFASPLPPNYSSREIKKFVLGVPYKFTSNNKNLFPDLDILEIVSDFDDVLPLPPKDKDCVHPQVRGSFIGQNSKECTFQVTELPNVNLFGGTPHFNVYKDQCESQPNFLVRGDSLLATRTGFNHKGTAFPNVASISSVIEQGNVSRVPIRDIPPSVFVNSVCAEFRVQLLIGGVDDPELRYPLISNADILLLGRITNLTNIGEFVLYVSKLLSEKYPKESTPPYIRSKVESLLEHGCVSASDRHTLLWPGMHEGMSLGDAHLITQFLVRGQFRPLVITIANGLSSLLPIDSVLEANSEIFPPHFYEDVHVIEGFVQVNNFDHHSNKYSSQSSYNLVSYLVGAPWASPKPWITSDTLPNLMTASVEKGTIQVAPDYNSDDQRISQQNLVVIVQTKMVREITDVFVKLRLCSFDTIRQSSLGPRWTYLNLSPRNDQCTASIKQLLAAKLVYCLPASLVSRPSCIEGVIMVKTSESWSYRRGTPLHLELVSEYLTAEGIKPIFFPTSDFFFKGIFPNSTDLPDFVQFLKDINKKVGSPWFSVVRFGKKDYKLCERVPPPHLPKVAARGSDRTPPLGKRSNFIFIEGLSLFQNRSEITSFFVSKNIPVLSCEWGRSVGHQHRLIVEVDVDVDTLDGFQK